MNDQFFRVGEQGVLQLTLTDDAHLLVRFRREIVAFFGLRGFFETSWDDSLGSPVPTSYRIASNPDPTGATVLFQQLLTHSWNIEVAVGCLSIRIDSDGSEATLVGSIVRHEPLNQQDPLQTTSERSGILMTAPQPAGHRKETR